MYTFHALVLPRPAQASEGRPLELRGMTFPTLAVGPHLLADSAFPVTFEQAAAALAELPRLFIEPDGSFVWVADDMQRSWQLDGQLYDRQDRLLYADLHGSCPAAAFDRLLPAVGWPGQPLMFQLVREAVYLDETGFRRYAAA